MQVRSFSDWYERNVNWEGSHHASYDDVHLIIFKDGRAMVREGHRKERNWKFFPNSEQGQDDFEARLRERW